MKTFLVIFTCTENGKNHQNWSKLDSKLKEERLQKGIQEKQEWFTRHRVNIIFSSEFSNGTKLVDSLGLHHISNSMGSFIIIKAKSIEEVTSLFINHPHFSTLPGDGVEIRECNLG
jgi:hypothetical protein